MKNDPINQNQPSPFLIVLGAVSFFIIGLAAYWPALNGDFIWDDTAMVTTNVFVKARDGLNYIWFSTAPTDYFPLTYTSFWLEWRLWGMKPFGYHATNILLHAASCVLLWRVLANAKIPGGWFAALLFLVHPVNVESVAWIAERKNTLSFFFYLLTLLAFLQFEQTGRRRLYIFSLIAFALSLLSKPSGVMLPFVLLGLAWWQRGKIGKWDWLRSLPFFALALAMGLVTIWFQYHRAIGDEVIHTRDFWTRLAGAGWAVWFYLFKAVWPVSLSFVYPNWSIDSHVLISYLPGAAMICVFILLWSFRREAWGRALLLAFGYFVLTLFPVLGFFKIYFQKYSLVADHWQYFALPAVLAVIGAQEDRLAKQQFGTGPERPSVLFIRGIWCSILAGLFVALTWRQAMIYKDGTTLWRDTLKKNPDCCLAYNNLGLLLEEKGKRDEAIGNYQQSLRIKPSQVEGHNNLGSAFYAQGKLDEAMVHYKAALQVNPAVALTHYNIGNVLDQGGKRVEAVLEYREALRLQPSYSEAHNNLACVLALDGKVDEAMAHFQEALRWNPDYADALSNLGSMLLERGRTQEAIGYLERAVALKPEHADAHYNLGNALLATQKISEAIAAYRAALALRPAMTMAHYKLGDVFLKLGEADAALEQFTMVVKQQPDSAEAHYQIAVISGVKKNKEETLEHLREAVRLKPNWLEALNNLAWFLATSPKSTFRDGVDAVKFAQRASEITGNKSAGALDTLAAAYAQTEQFTDAINTALAARELAVTAGQTNLAVQIEGRLERYQNKLPYHEW